MLQCYCKECNRIEQISILIDSTNNHIIAKFECDKSIDLGEIKLVPLS